MKKSLKYIVVIVVIILVDIFIISSLFFGNKNKTINKQINNINVTENSPHIENENLKITVEKVLSNSVYLILKYNVNYKEDHSQMFDDLMVDDEFQFSIDRRIIINGETLNTDSSFFDQVPYRISNNEVIVYDIIDISDRELPEDITIDIKFYENSVTAYEDHIEEEPDINDEEDLAIEDEDIKYESDIDPDEYYEQSYLREGTEGAEKNDDIEYDPSENTEEIEVGLLEENASPEDYEEVEGEFIWNEEKEQELKEREEKLNEEEPEIIGTIKYEAFLEDLESNLETNITQNNYNSGNLIIEKSSLIKTEYGIILIINSQISNIDYSNIYMEQSGDPYTYRIDIKDENDQKIYLSEKNKVILTDSNGNTEEDINEKSTNIMANITTRAIIDDTKNIDKLKIEPYLYLEDGNIEKIGDGCILDIK